MANRRREAQIETIVSDATKQFRDSLRHMLRNGGKWQAFDAFSSEQGQMALMILLLPKPEMQHAISLLGGTTMFVKSTPNGEQ